MNMIDTALKAAEMIGVRDRTPYEKARAAYNNLASQAVDAYNTLPSRSTTDWTSLTVGLIVGTAIGFGIGLYVHDSMQPAMRSARKQMKKAQDVVQDQVGRLNITRMEETPASKT